MSENMEKVYDVIVVGSGPAGLTAALYCARAGYETLVLEKYIPGGQMVTSNEIENYPGFPEAVDGFTLTMNMKKQAERFGAKQTYGNVTALRLDGDAKILETEDGTVYRAKSVVLAPGAAPRTLGLPNEDALRGKGVSYCATCDGAFYKDKMVAVIGGGDTAAGDAAFLSAMCKKVYLIHRRDQLRASRVYLEPLKQAENVEILWDSQVTELLYGETLTGAKVRHKKTGETRELSLDGLFLAVGQLPNTQLFQGQVELDAAGYVVADETTRTNLPGVFAVGDLRQKPLRQVVTAAADGAVAAHFLEEYLSQQQS